MRHRGRYNMCWLTAHEREAGASLLPARGPSTGRRQRLLGCPVKCVQGILYRAARASASWVPVSLTACSVASTLRMATATWRSGIRTVLASQRCQLPP